MSIIENLFQPLYGKDCWQVEQGYGSFLTFEFGEAMDMSVIPQLVFTGDNPLTASLVSNSSLSGWQDDHTYLATYDVVDAGEELNDIQVSLVGANDQAANSQLTSVPEHVFSIDTRNPVLLILSANTYDVNDENVGPAGFSVLAVFDETMSLASTPVIQFPDEDPSSTLTFNGLLSGWLNNTTYKADFDVSEITASLLDIDLRFAGLYDVAGNAHAINTFEDYFSIVQTVGTADFGNNSVTLMPNPVEKGNTAIIKLADASTDMMVQVYSAEGRLISELTGTNNAGMLGINTAAMPVGMYFVKISDNNKHQVLKLSVQ